VTNSRILQEFKNMKTKIHFSTTLVHKQNLLQITKKVV